MKYELELREVEILETELEIGEGCFVIDAEFVDNGEKVSDADLELLTDKYQSELYEDAYSHAASMAYDYWKDRD